MWKTKRKQQKISTKDFHESNWSVRVRGEVDSESNLKKQLTVSTPQPKARRKISPIKQTISIPGTTSIIDN